MRLAALVQEALTRRTALLDFAGLGLFFLISRISLRLMGFPFSLSFDWMYLADPEELRTNLLETLLYFHSFPPVMNALTGVLLKLNADDPSVVARWLFEALGLVMVWSLYYSARILGTRRWLALAVSAAFTLLPATLFFEHLYLYTHLVACMLMLAGALLCLALRWRSFACWLSFFSLCALLGMTRTTLHISWFALMVVLALFAAGRAQRHRVLGASLVPLLLLLALYTKNYVLFDSFGATSTGGGNFVLVTTMRLSKQERTDWIKQGKISEIANVSVYAPPRVYSRFFGSSESARWPQISALEKPSTGAPNYNHWFFMKANAMRVRDARVYLAERPGDYARTVLESSQQVFGPSTRWHPADRQYDGKVDPKRARASPHHPHRQVLGGYERLVNFVLHRFPVSPIGLYALLPIFMLASAWRAFRSFKAERRVEMALILYSLVQVSYIVVVSSLFTIGESSRYRFQVEALIWLLVIAGARPLRLAISTVWARVASRKSSVLLLLLTSFPRFWCTERRAAFDGSRFGV